MRQPRCAKATQGSSIVFGQKWSRPVFESYGKATTVCIDIIQEWSGCMEKLKAG